MKHIVRQISTVAAFLGLLCSSAHAVITTISRQGCDIVLTWPSTPGQVFTVQFRDSLSPGSTWMTLTNGLPAAAGAATTFVHPNVLPDCGGQMQAQAAANSTTVTDEERAARREELRKQAEALDIRCCLTGPPPSSWTIR
jgi:hypothetical protein